MSEKFLRLDYSGRDVCVIHVATSGFDPLLDRIIGVAVVKLRHGVAVRRYQSLVRPEAPILAAATAVHGLGEAEVSGARTFDEVAPGLARFLGRSDFAGFELRRFALPFLYSEFERHGVEFRWSPRSVVDVGELYRRYEPRDLAAAARHYLGPDRSVGDGMAGAAETVAEVLRAQLARHEDLALTARGLPCSPPCDAGGWLGLEGHELVFRDGPHRGRTLEQVARRDPVFLRWLAARGALWDIEGPVGDALKRGDAGPERVGRVPKGG